MLDRVTAIEFQRPVGSGKTQPMYLVCERSNGAIVEAFTKFSGFCERGVTSLAIEAVSACLAGDLGLPVPEPILVEAPQEWVEALPTDRKDKVRDGSAVAFGSRAMTGQWSLWNAGTRLSTDSIPTALAVLVLDAIINNPDRRADNPNCLVRGEEIRIIDHELAFAHRLVIGWKPPWVEGGLKSLETLGSHIFRDALRGCAIDFAPVRAAWAGLTDDMIASYQTSLPAEWAEAQKGVEDALSLIRDARDHIDGCLDEVERVLG